MKYQLLSDNEFAVLQAMWKVGEPLTRPEILERIADNDWNPNSIHLVLNNLIKKGFVAIDGVARCGQGYGRTYVATKTQGEYAAELAFKAIPDVPEEDRVVHVMSAMVKGKTVSEKTLDLLSDMLDQRRRELQQGK